MSLLLSHPFGNPNSYNVAAGLHERGTLGRFHTCLYAPFGTSRRRYSSFDAVPICQHRIPELFRLAMTRCPVQQWNGRSPGFVDWVARRFDSAVARSLRRHHSAVYCYEDAAHSTFLRAKEFGIRTIYDLPTGYFEAKSCLSEEIAAHPSLLSFFPALAEPEDKLERKRQELALADVILCASSFTQQSIAGHVGPEKPIIVVPYGSDIHIKPKAWSHSDFEGPLQVLFIGQLAPQKGLHYLFDALSQLPNNAVRLSLAGRWVPGFSDWIRARYSVPFIELGQVPHAQVPGLCRANHVLVFPSLFDGFGLVILEAMAAGIPVIASTRSGGPDLIHELEDGMIVPAASASQLRDALAWMIEHRDRVAEMGRSARQTAERYTWDQYRNRVVQAVSSHVD